MRELFAGADEVNVADILKATNSIPMEELKLKLGKLTETVQDELFEVINHDFAKFQEILRQVCDVNIEELRTFRDQYSHAKNENEKIYLEYKNRYEALKSKRDRVVYVDRKLELAKNLKRANNYLSRFSLLKEKQISQISPFELEVACVNYLWTASFLSQGKSYTEFDFELLIQELGAYSESLQSMLEEKISESLQSGNDVELLACLCAKLNKLSIFETTFRFVMVEDVLARMIQVSVQVQSTALIDFRGFLNNVSVMIRDLRDSWKPLVDKLYPNTQYKFLVRSILGPTLAWIQQNISSVFVPSKLPEFKINFEAALAFVSALEEEHFVYEDEIAFFRGHAAWAAFMKRWSLHQYYQIQVQQLLQPLDVSLSKPIEIVSEPKISGQTVLVVNALKKLWSPNSLLTPLIPKLLKSTLQTTRRFIAFCKAEESQLTNPSNLSLFHLQKRFNLVQFRRLFRDTIFPSFQKGMDRLEYGLAERLLNDTILTEIDAAILSIEDGILPAVEHLYEKLLIACPSIKTLQQLSLQSLLNVKNPKFDLKISTEALSSSLEKILIKFNRSAFKLIDQHGAQSLSFLPEKMTELEAEAAQLGRESLRDEEFWIEIKQEILKNSEIL